MPLFPRDLSMIDMATTFLGYFKQDGRQRDLDAAMTMLEKVYARTFAPVESTPPVVPSAPQFADTAQPGQVVSLLVPAVKPLGEVRPDVLDEERE